MERSRPRRAEPGAPETPTCPKHDGDLDVFCCTDHEIVCAVCAALDHRGHTFGSVGVERRRGQEKLQELQTRSEQVLQTQEKKLRDLEKMLIQIQEQAKETAEHCEATLVGVIESLQRHHLSARRLIGGQEEAELVGVRASMKKLQQEMEQQRRRRAALDRLGRTHSDVYFLQEWPSLQRLCEDDNNNNNNNDDDHPRPPGDPPGTPPPPGAPPSPGARLRPFLLAQKAAERLGRDLLEICSREFARFLLCLVSDAAEVGAGEAASGAETPPPPHVSSERADSAPEEEEEEKEEEEEEEVEEEPSSREHFLRYACDVTLDSCTAHKDLRVSADGKQVRLVPRAASIPAAAARRPERFVHRRQVLCREGLRARRCYYEVELDGDKAEIALVYRRMDRRSRQHRSAFGGNPDSWSLDRAAKYNVSHDCRSLELHARPKHARIGVFLQFQEGSVSFYEVSDSRRMVLLHALRARFTQPLVPGFWLGDKCGIRIVDLTRD